ncbi:septum formation initiator family protein [Bacillus sp. ISL-47]|uniref:FtsB family cell division protein n=1 Tax=Bacillus sp. ISL-47 TaxID=2819130 RepID=UPI001BE5D75E|nr:septum formation initiator family protein [Bacillus sp. ISL-47]MBT2688724.1 septum formation initiator family protein [Bacillus sp. ISL-47]MBT2709546.1 septum formation initiator family protein [Pseudomonas sp. ISL-84]
MSVSKKRNIAKIETSYVRQQEAAEISAGRKRKLLFRRLAAFFTLASVLSFFMISTLVSQSAALEEKVEEKNRLDKELAALKKKEVILEEEIVKLNDDEYIAKLARKDYFLSDNNEIIFNLPEETDKDKQNKEKSTD